MTLKVSTAVRMYRL